MRGLWLSIGLLAYCAACSAPGEPSACTEDRQCSGAGERCLRGRCAVPSDADDRLDAVPPGLDATLDAAMEASVGPVDAGDANPATGDARADACTVEFMCGARCCAAGQRCAAGTCARDLGRCASDDECQSDSYCLEGACVPYGVPADRRSNPTCQRTISIDALRPTVQCRWTEPPMGDMRPGHNQAMSTPVVMDLDLDDTPSTRFPSIVFATFPASTGIYGNPGVLRIIDGRDCTEQQSFHGAEELVVSTASPALGDLDGDGRPEIVAVAHGGGLLAFRYDPMLRRFARWWRSGTCAAGGMRTRDTYGAGTWGGPALHDLDDDGRPEIVLGGVVYDREGCIVDASLGNPAYSFGIVPVVADVDADGRAELVGPNRLHEWNPMLRRWVAETYFRGTALSSGQVAVAEMGMFPLVGLDGADGPEVVVIASGTARVQDLEGRVRFGPLTIPGGGTGGPPTIADFDGDGRAEFATAGGGRYVVFDLDCVAGGDPARCNEMSRTDGILWSQVSQDNSSNVTGSSVFDFNADGRAEAVYADECYLRVYEGRTGRVVASIARSSGTAYENPVIADVDGDFRSEIVSTVNNYAGTLGCPARDPLLASTPFSTNRGVVVLRDETDRWAASRPVWNQHAYHVTHVEDDGTTPRTSMVRPNWRTPGLNNFRQNVQGRLAALGLPDLTVTADPGPLVLMCAGDRATLRARVCNRGLLPTPPGITAEFREASASGTVICRATVNPSLGPGECEPIACEGPLPPRTIDVAITVNSGPGAADECLRGNNTATIRSVFCGTPG
jgi:hypothetical protein